MRGLFFSGHHQECFFRFALSSCLVMLEYLLEELFEKLLSKLKWIY